jgi:hypothetical protein
MRQMHHCARRLCWRKIVMLQGNRWAILNIVMMSVIVFMAWETQLIELPSYLSSLHLQIENPGGSIGHCNHYCDGTVLELRTSSDTRIINYSVKTALWTRLTGYLAAQDVSFLFMSPQIRPRFGRSWGLLFFPSFNKLIFFLSLLIFVTCNVFFVIWTFGCLF